MTTDQGHYVVTVWHADGLHKQVLVGAGVDVLWVPVDGSGIVSRFTDKRTP